MREREKKILEYLLSFDPKKKIWGDIAHDLAKIAEKDYAEKEKEYLEEITGRDGIIGKVIDERDELKRQIENIKYLDRGKVEKIMMNFAHDCGGTSILISLRDDYITKICKLAIPITKEKIIKKLEHLKQAGFIIGDIDDSIINFILGEDIMKTNKETMTE